MSPRRNPRRGVLLLIVLSLLVLFVLIGVTFVVVAGQYASSAGQIARHEQKGDSPVRELDEVVLQLLRGTTDPNQLMYRHSLLQDLYGNDGFMGTINRSFAPQAQIQPIRQFLTIEFVDLSRSARPSNHYYSGSVLTLVDGQGAQHSTRIVRYTKPELAGNLLLGSLTVEAFEGLPMGFQPPPGTKFIVNGKPFNGTGQGFNAATGKLDLKDPLNSGPFELALLPLYPRPLPGDVDESWDAADYQNLFLARIPTVIPGTTNLGSGIALATDPLIPSFHRPFLINHLAQRLSANGMSWSMPALANLRRAVIARPMPDDHPLFTGGNSRLALSADLTGDLNPDTDGDGIPECLDFDNDNDNMIDDLDGDGLADVPLIRGPWDVDNDSDGVMDSVWVDLGAPVKTAADGRIYKPLFAILCVDLDGRINLNVHGSRERFALAASRIVTGTPVPDASAAGNGDISQLTLGQGYGPAEIRLDRVLPYAINDPPYWPANPQLNVNIYGEIINKRYQPRTGLIEDPPAPGWADYRPGQPDQPIPYPHAPDPTSSRYTASLLNSFHHWGLASDFRAPQPFEGNLYGTPPDIAGVGGIYLDHVGQPKYANLTQLNSFSYLGSPSALNFPAPFTSAVINAVQDNPYEFDLVNSQGGDSPFDEADLEQLLRYRDWDSLTFPTSLSRILANYAPLTDPLLRNEGFRRRLTTRSFDIPALAPAIPEDDERQQVLAQTAQEFSARFATPDLSTLSSSSLVELATRRLLAGNNTITPVELDRQLRLILPPEVRQGQRFDINRLLGNGVDDNNNGVVDEPLEFVTAPQAIWNGTPFQSVGSFAVSDPNYVYPPQTIDNSTNGNFSRQVFARYLYCLAMLAMDPDFEVEAPQDRKEITAKRIAQWAINVVDFRDPDVIMTPFEYDIDPFDTDGWSVDDDFRTVQPYEQLGASDRRIVWGCESPELLITETLAFHDRRVRDTDQEIIDASDQDTGTRAAKRLPDENADGDPLTQNPDYDHTLDQFRIPQGSLFIELYAAGNSDANVGGAAALPAELYTPLGALDLGRVISDDQGASPVWRVAIAAAPLAPDPAAWTSDADLALLLPALFQDPDPTRFLQMINDKSMSAQFGALGLPDQTMNYDRFVLFSDVIPNRVPGGTYYYNRNRAATNFPAPQLRPGNYAIVGSRQATAIGAVNRRTSAPPLNEQDPSKASNQRLVLAADGLHYYNLTSTEVPQIYSRPALPIIATADPPPAWAVADLPRTAPFGIGVSISEPKPSTNYYRQPSDPPSPPERIDPVPNRSPVEPGTYYQDLIGSSQTLPDVPFDNPDPANVGRPLGERPDAPMAGTHRGFRVALLQRLADPTRSWDAVTNPYITVDSQPIDLTVFNGEDENYSLQAASPFPTGWDQPDNPANGEPYDIADDPQQRPAFNLEVQFQARHRGLLAETASLGGSPNLWNPFSTPPSQTPLAAVNTTYFPYNLEHSLGALNPTYGMRLTTPANYLGAPLKPFTWLTWQNRPFANHFELMLVPSSAPWRLPYECRQTQPPAGEKMYEVLHAPWGHLFNFMFNDPNGPDINLSALLDWVEVPSRFAGTQKWVNAQIPFTMIPPAFDLQSYAAPFNKLPRFRDPGKINLNTIPDALVWSAIDVQSAVQQPNDPTQTPWQDIVRSLKGKVTATDYVTAADNKIGARPAFYANPFRAAGSGDVMPNNLLEQSTVDAGLLRRHPDNDEQMLFSFLPTGSNVNDPMVHPYYRYHKVQRLSNLLTSHSNVYAVWITVGYFEVLPWPAGIDAAHPDGYQLASEIGSERGTAKRHRSFYLIDRSIPVGFERGKNLNVEDAILLRRHLE